MKKWSGLTLLLFLIGILPTEAQEILDYTFDGSEHGKPVNQVFRSIETQTQGKIYFLDAWLKDFPVMENQQGKTLSQVLDKLFADSDLSFISMYPSSLVIVKDPEGVIAYKEALQVVREDMKIEKFVLGDGPPRSNAPVTITGRVVDGKSGEGLPGATVELVNTQRNVTTDATGKFSLTIQPGAYVLQYRFPKYEDKAVDLIAWKSGEIVVSLELTYIQLQEVVIEDKAAVDLTTSRIGQTDLSMTALKRAPALLGEVDIIKQVQVLPGVTTVGEAASGFNVRGGSVDQNLILYDGIPVYNSSHIFGFLSSFNPEAIGDVSFMRGGIPARYGGRASSVLDIKSKEGSYKKWNGNAGIGMITSNIMVNGPLKKDKTSLLASVRSTYSNWLVRSVRTDYGDLQKSSVYFYDGTVNLFHNIDNDTKLSVTNYFSKDAFRLIGDSTFQWSNFQTSAKLNRSFANGTEGEFVFGVGNYGYRVINDNVRTASEHRYSITTTVLRAGFNKEKIAHLLNFGAEALHYRFQPGQLEPTSAESNVKSFAMQKQFSLELAVYGSDELKLTETLTMEAGLRIPLFLSFGPSTQYRYAPGPLTPEGVADTVRYNSGQIAKAYSGLEPRLSLRLALNQTSSLKLGFNRIFQYLHLVTNTTAVTPVDIWQPSNYYFKPQRADQLSFGYVKESKDKAVSASLEAFYKINTNVVDFKDGAQLTLNDHLETELLQGKGESYGIETFITKNSGRLTGSLNYTYSRAFREISGPSSSEQINQGKRYPSNFDQPHIANISWKYNLSRRYFFTGYFTYHTGRPVTIPQSAFAVENLYVAYFSGRNQYRIPDYHRLDVAFVVEGSHRKNKHVQGHWVFSLYNVYGRRNPYAVFFKTTTQGVPKPYQLSIVGTVLPSISYNVKFQ
ncbi:MAG TPA: TonB-dependent receptor [Chryseosolibacter sp.]